MSVYEKTIPQWKQDSVDNLTKTINDSKMIGLVNVEGVGAKQLQGIRDNLRGSAVIKMARNTLMIRAIEKSSKKGLKDLIEHVNGPVSFVFSEQDPFMLSKFLSENKTAAPAKGGQIAPKDIIVPEMNTGVAPGPFISELAGLKIPSRVRGGAIHITADTVAVASGDVISNAMALMLSRLGIEPMELQLKLIAAYSDGEVLTADSFDLDLEALFSQVIAGHQYAINLSVNAGIPTEETVPLIIAKANMEAKSLALEVGFFVPDLMDVFLGRANSEASALIAAVSEKDPEALPSELVGKVQTAAAAASTAAAPATDAAEQQEPDKPEEDDEEESVAGIGGLFG
ncbi:MAG: 50S ribosomal protein L10 [Candidatus Thorarchaeota archaeon]|jgi:large subunit ribosomal protein L10